MKVEKEKIISLLKYRFDNNMTRHKDILWEDVLEKLSLNSDALISLSKMEETGGEPDIIAYDKEKDEYVFCDCSKESPTGRRNVCYDKEALDSRKSFKPNNNAVDMAKEIGIEIINIEEYKKLQSLGDFDTKTSSWIKTPDEIRKLGGAIFGDRRYNTVFIYHNGAESYYSVRGFRGLIRI